MSYRTFNSCSWCSASGPADMIPRRPCPDLGFPCGSSFFQSQPLHHIDPCLLYVQRFSPTPASNLLAMVFRLLFHLPGVFSPFPHGTRSLSVTRASLEMVLPDSDGCPAVLRYCWYKTILNTRLLLLFGDLPKSFPLL